MDRLKAAEPDAKTIVLSVKQLHADLSAEIESAREYTQAVIAQVRKQADAAWTEAAEAEAERAQAYEQRVKKLRDRRRRVRRLRSRDRARSQILPLRQA